MLYVTLAGRLGRDAELRATQGGDPVCGFSVAVDIRRGQEKATQWVECSIFGKRGEALAQYLTKGTCVTALGALQVREYQKRDGTHGVAVECRVSEITLQGGKRDEAESPAPRASRPMESYPSTPARPVREPAPAGGDPFNDDIPFAPHDHRSIA